MRATDAAGNTDASPAQYTWTVDTVAPTPPSTRTRPTRRARPTRTSRSRPPKAARRSSARSTAAASPPARARRTTPASPRAATPSRCAPPTRPGTRTPRRPSTRGRSTRSRPARPRASRAAAAPTTPPAGTRAAAPSASAARTPTRPRACRRSRSPSARARATTGTALRSEARARSGTRPPSRAATGPTPSPRPTSRPTAATRSASRRPTTRATARLRRAAPSRYDTADPSALFSFPALGRRLQRRGLERGLRHDRLLRHVLRRDLGRPDRRDLHPPGRGQLLERHLVRQRLRGLPDGVALGRQLVVRVPGVELPGRRRLHRPRPRDGQRVEHGDGPEPDLHGSTTRTRARSSPSRPRAAPTRTPAGTRAAARTASAARTRTRPPASRPWTSPIQRVSTGLYWNGSAFSSGSEDFQAASFSGGNWSYAFPASSFPADGSYAVHIRAHDNAGNTETGPSRSFTIDSVAPNTTVDSGPSDPSASADAAFAFSATEGGSTFECELDGGGFSACSSPKSYTSLVRRQPHVHRCAPSMQPGTPTPLRRSRPGRSTPSRRARR